MGLFDPPKQENLADVFPPGTPFRLERAWVEGVVPTQYGDRLMAKIVASPVDGGDAREFAVWGSLCEQIQASDQAEYPAVVIVEKDGRRWLFKPAPDSAAGTQAAAVAAGEGDNPLTDPEPEPEPEPEQLS